MKAKRANAVFENLYDSVSRIIINMGFASCDNTAHAKLLSILKWKLEAMSFSCRILAENAGRKSMSTSSPDLKHFFRVNRVDFESLKDYMGQVGPFPPTRYQIHGDPLFGKDVAEPEVEIPIIEEVRVKEERKITKPCSFLPIFDDMDDEDLGYSSLLASPLPSPSSPVFLPPPPPPPVIPPLSPPLPMPEFNPEVPPPVLPDYMNPEMPVKLPVDLPVRLRITSHESTSSSTPSIASSFGMCPQTKFSLKHTPASIVPSRASKSFDLPRLSEKSLSSASVVQEARMTKKRKMHAKYERRLREEQMSSEAKKKRKFAEKSSERVPEKPSAPPQYILKFDNEEVARYTPEGPKVPPVPKIPVSPITRNQKNKKKINNKRVRYTPRTATSSTSVTKPEPLPKILIKYEKTNKGHLIQQISVTTHRLVNSQWLPIKTLKLRNKRGILSMPQQALKIEPKIAKIRLARNRDGSYQIIKR